MTGPELFARYAVPPNVLGYCGPSDVELLKQLLDDRAPPGDELVHTARLFDGAYPYLQLIGGVAGKDPLDRSVVEAYWTGNRLLDTMDPQVWLNDLDDRFRHRAGKHWATLTGSLPGGGVPNHAFHVFCVYPWVGLLRTGAIAPALGTLDRCRISWGEVVGISDGAVQVRSSHLGWAGERLEPGPPLVTTVAPGPDPLTAGDVVSIHWETVCERLTRRRLAQLRRVHDRHLAIANTQLVAV